jgi:hypothetical protein
MIPERRRHRRIFTIRNFVRLLLLGVVFLAGLSVEVTMRDHSGDYGRLVNKEIPQNKDIQPRPQPVVEAPPKPVADQSAADPLLLDSAAREQEFLSTASITPQPPSVTTVGTGNAVSVQGDPSGITIVRSKDVPKRPVLAGGIFKQP